LPDDSYAKLAGVEVLVVDAAHFSFASAIDAIERIHTRHVWSMHIGHDATHAEIEALIEKAVSERRASLEVRYILHTTGSGSKTERRAS
jgi:hypothetical protein